MPTRWIKYQLLCTHVQIKCFVLQGFRYERNLVESSLWLFYMCEHCRPIIGSLVRVPCTSPRKNNRLHVLLTGFQDNLLDILSCMLKVPRTSAVVVVVCILWPLLCYWLVHFTAEIFTRTKIEDERDMMVLSAKERSCPGDNSTVWKFGGWSMKVVINKQLILESTHSWFSLQAPWINLRLWVKWCLLGRVWDKCMLRIGSGIASYLYVHIWFIWAHRKQRPIKISYAW